MPPSRERPGSPADWLARARGDLAIATAPLPDGAYYEDFCFHVQQAAEKAIKAVYQKHGWEFKYTHDLESLFEGLVREGLNIPAEIIETDVLSRYAWESRYPGIDEPVTVEEFKEALKMAQDVVTWASRQLE